MQPGLITLLREYLQIGIHACPQFRGQVVADQLIECPAFIEKDGGGFSQDPEDLRGFQVDGQRFIELFLEFDW